MVAVIDGEATVKKLVVATGYQILQPVSTVRTRCPIVVESDFRVLGKVVRVLKKGSHLLREVFEDESERELITMGQQKRHHVDFIGTKRVKRLTEVAFRTKTGQKVDFVARKPVAKKVKISFMARNKKK